MRCLAAGAKTSRLDIRGQQRCLAPSRNNRSFVNCSARLKQNILCVRSTTRLVFETENSLCRKQNIPCVPDRTFLVLHAEHSLCSKQNIPCVRSRTFLALRARDSVCSNQHHCTCHFLVNSTNRPRISANRNQIRPNPGTIGRIRQKMACKISNFERLKNREDTSDFDDFLMKTIASTRSIFSKIFARPKNFSRRRKNSI